MYKTIVSALFIVVMISACTNTPTEQEAHLAELPFEELSAEEVSALAITLQDEFRAETIYQRVLEDYGDVRPFSNIIYAEQKHSTALIALHNKYDLPIAENNWYGEVPRFASVTEACAAGVQAEIENVALYDELFAQVDNEDIIIVFTNLRDASQDKHLPAFERCGGQK